MLNTFDKPSPSQGQQIVTRQLQDIVRLQTRDIMKGFSLLLIWLIFSIVFFTTHSYAEEAPEDFTITTLDGHNFSLTEYQNKKPVFLFFWATWCPICKKEIPRIKALHEEFGDEIEILAINVGYNDSLANIKQYQQQYQVQFPIAFDEHSEISQNYGVIGTPTQVVIDIDGDLRYHGNQFPAGLESLLHVLSTPKTPTTSTTP